jgi:dihydroflavonol-4-reductase
VKALITGGTGFIGSHLVELLVKKGYAVRCLIRRTSDTRWLSGVPAEYVYGDLFDADALREAVGGVDFVYHAAGVTKSKTKEGYYTGNTTGTANLLDAVKKFNPTLKRFVHLSSQTVAGPSPTKTPITEEVDPRPITTYGMSKLKAEEECRKVSSSFPITILRLPAVYGPRDKDVFEFFNTIGKGLQPMVGFREKYVSLLHVADVVRGLVMAAESPVTAGQTYFISSKGVYGWREVGDVAKRVMEKAVLRVRIPEFGVYLVSAFAEFFALFSSKPALINFEKARDMVQDYWTCDSSRANRDFGFEQEISLEEGMRETIAWYRAEGWLR